MVPTTRPCDACGTPTDEPRAGLCPKCHRLEPSGVIPAHGACASCHERRRILLRWTRLPSALVVTCFNCGHVADFAEPRVQDIPSLRALLQRDRRGAAPTGAGVGARAGKVAAADRRGAGAKVDGAVGRRKRIRRTPDRRPEG